MKNLLIKKVSGEKGFTLIELAIVMVIIGIILGSILKGQDLIQNARAKKLVNWDKEWEMAAWNYMDRKGYFPGDSDDNNGIIGNSSAEQTATTDGIYEITNANFINTPSATLTLGSTKFYLFLGHDNDTADKNVIVICKDSSAVCATALTSSELVYAEAIDVTYDGTADQGAGNVRAISASTSTGAGIAIDSATELTTSGVWTTAAVGLVYYFDKPHT